MPRNLRNRIEQCTPILDATLKDRIINNLNRYLQDTENAWLLGPEGQYIKIIAGSEDALGAQRQLLIDHAENY